MFLTKINSKVMKVVDVVIVLSMAMLTLCISLQVLNRFIMKIPMPWTEEYARYIFVWLAMFGSAKAVREKSHIFVDILEVLIKGRVAQVTGLLADLISLVFYILLLYVSIPWTVQNFAVNTESIPEINLGLFYLCIPVSALLMLLFALENLYFRFKPQSTLTEEVP